MSGEEINERLSQRHDRKLRVRGFRAYWPAYGGERVITTEVYRREQRRGGAGYRPRSQTRRALLADFQPCPTMTADHRAK